jgi:hypothetical protein
VGGVSFLRSSDAPATGTGSGGASLIELTAERVFWPPGPSSCACFQLAPAVLLEYSHNARLNRVLCVACAYLRQRNTQHTAWLCCLSRQCSPSLPCWCRAVIIELPAQEPAGPGVTDSWRGSPVLGESAWALSESPHRKCCSGSLGRNFWCALPVTTKTPSWVLAVRRVP